MSMSSQKNTKFSEVSNRVDFVRMEHKILDFWESNETFRKLVDKNKGKPKWSFLDGPITANNPMGVHHAWGRTLKDIYQRYHAMLGHELRYQNGFDCQGLWVEVEVEKELGFKSKRDVEEFGIEKFVNLCKKRVEKYSRIQTDQSKRLGYWMDWENSYYTMSDENNYSIWAFLKKLFEDGKIYRGTDVVPWSGRSGTSYSQMEIIEGRKLVAHSSAFVKFPLKNRENENLLVWTTTPWTLTANIAAAVNVNLNYTKLRANDGQLYYFAEDNFKFQRLEKQFKEKKQWIEGVPKLKTIEQIFKERGGYTLEGNVKGADLVGLEYSGPFDELPAQNIPGGYPYSNSDLKDKKISPKSCHRVIDGGKDNIGNDVVVAGEGTGIIHVATGCGDIDNKLGKKYNLASIAPLDDESNYIDEFDWLTGLSATDPVTTEKIINDLKGKGVLLYVEKYPHIYPHCWRSGDELVFRMVEEWYINMDWRNQIKKIVDDIQWIPSWGQEKEHEWLENMGDWMISKKRFWGLALPIWTFEDGSFYVVGSREELQELAVEGWDEFEGMSPHRPWIDKVKIKHPETGLVGERIQDVGNPWLDAGIVPFSTLNFHSDRNYWEDWYPADFITECFPGQFRNWFYSLLAMATVMDNSAPFKTLLGHALVKDETGRDMHKSWGNAIWFEDAAEKMGVDVMRWQYAAQNPEHNLLFGYHTADEVRKRLITLWNTYSFFVTYARLDGFDPADRLPDSIQLTKLDRWILAKVNKLVKTAGDCYSGYQTYRLMDEVVKFIDDLSNWYVRRNRRRFWKSENDEDKTAAYSTLYKVLVTFTRMMAPIIPFITEEMYGNLVSSLVESPESIHLTDFPEYDESIADDELVREIDAVISVVSMGRSARNKANIKNRQPLEELVVSTNNGFEKNLKDNKEQILEELNVKNVKFIEEENEIITFNIKPNFPLMGQKYGADLKNITNLLKEMDDEDVINKVKSKQPLSLQSNGFSVDLEPEDLIIEEQAVGNYSVISNKNFIVGIKTVLSDSLINEGIVRDLVRQVQNLRKESEFKVEDRIHVSVDGPDKINTAVEDFKSYFLNEVLGKTLNNKEQKFVHTKSVNINGHIVDIGISQISEEL